MITILLIIMSIEPYYKGLYSYQYYGAGGFMIITFVEWAPKLILIIKAPQCYVSELPKVMPVASWNPVYFARSSCRLNKGGAS